MEFVENSKKALEAAERRNVKESESKQVSNLFFIAKLSPAQSNSNSVGWANR